MYMPCFISLGGAIIITFIEHWSYDELDGSWMEVEWKLNLVD
jgi:hypothetical protein